MKPLNKNLIMLAALYIIPLTGLSIDIYVPSLPTLSHYFATTAHEAQNTISIYILGLGLSQLFCGNIIDHYGRRKPLLISLILYFILANLIIHMHSITHVSILRLFQGIAMGFIAVSARSIFVDLYSGEEYYKKASYMTIAYSIGPIIAPAIGGYLEYLLGWKACFYFLVIYSLLGIAIVYFYIPETIVHRSKMEIKLIIHRYSAMLGNKEYMLNVIMLCMLNTALMLFALIGPFLVQNKLHYSAVIFGQMALLCGVSWFAGNLTNRLLIDLDRKQKIKYSLLIGLIDIVIMFVLALFWFNLYVIIIPVCILLIAASVIFSNLFVHSPTLFPKFSATAAAFMAGAFALLSSATCGILSKLITTNNQIPLVIGYAVLFLCCIICTSMSSSKDK